MKRILSSLNLYIMKEKKPEELALFTEFRDRFNGIVEVKNDESNTVIALTVQRLLRSKNFKSAPHHIVDVVLTSYKRELTRNKHQITCISGDGVLKITSNNGDEEAEEITLGTSHVLQIMISGKHEYEIISKEGMEVEIVVIEG